MIFEFFDEVLGRNLSNKKPVQSFIIVLLFPVFENWKNKVILTMIDRMRLFFILHSPPFYHGGRILDTLLLPRVYDQR